MDNDQGSYYAVIPSYVMQSKLLSANDKLVYGQVASLTSAKGYCWANNSSIGNAVGIKPGTASKIIGHLVECGFLARRVKRNEKNEIIKRYLTIRQPEFSTDPYDDDNKQDGQAKNDPPMVQRDHTPIVPSDDTPMVQRGKERLKGLDVVVGRAITTEYPLAFYQRAFGKPATGLLSQTLSQLTDKYGGELLNYSFWLASDNGYGYPYAKAIFDSWIQQGVKTIKEAQQKQLEFKKQHTKHKKNSGYKSNVKPIDTPTVDFDQQLYNAFINNGQDVDKTIKQYKKLDGIDVTAEQIRGVYRERA